MIFAHPRPILAATCAALSISSPSFAEDDGAKPAPPAPPQAFEISPEVAAGEPGRKFAHEKGEITVSAEAALTGGDVKWVRVFRVEDHWSVLIRFEEKGTKRLFELSGELAKSGRRLVIIADGKIISAPVVREAIPNGHAHIAAGFTKESATALAETINAGRTKPAE